MQTTNISPLLSGNFHKYKFLTGKFVLPEKDLLEKAAAIKKFQYSTLTKEFKNPTSTAVKLYQKQDKVFESNENEGEEI